MSIIPRKLAHYYGFPSLVRTSGGPLPAPDTANAINVLKEYDMVVFGNGISDPSHPDHANTTTIINGLTTEGTDTYGYVDATKPYIDAYTDCDNWKSMGVTGIFFDQFGYDFNVSRERQNSLISFVRFLGLHSYVNAWNVDDVFGSQVDANMNPTGLNPVIDQNDWYLAESYQIVLNDYQNVNDWRTKSDKMLTYRSTFNTNMAAITTTNDQPFEQGKADYSYYSSVLDGLDAWGWGEQFFSASDNLLPYRTRKAVFGSVFDSVISEDSGLFERDTNVGVLVDTNSHTVDYILPRP